jgi:hypothetical protein
MSGIRDKEYFETHFFERFVKLYKDLPRGVAVKTESPDFLIKGGGEIVGVEISKILNEKEPGQQFAPSERNSIEQKIAINAKELFLERHRLHLCVDFAFCDSIDVGKGKDVILAESLAQLVAEQVTGRSLSNHFHLYVDRDLPEELMAFGITFHPRLSGSVWYAAKAQMVPELNKDYLLSIIKRKEMKLSQYKAKADKVILLLIEGLVPDGMFDKIEPVRRDEVNSGFDRVLILRNLHDQIIAIR